MISCLKYLSKKKLNQKQREVVSMMYCYKDKLHGCATSLILFCVKFFASPATNSLRFSLNQAVHLFGA